MAPFAFRRRRVTVDAAHALEVPRPFRRALWVFEPLDAAVVLGSTQSLADLDLASLHRERLGVVRRHSGGGMVVIRPGEVSWFDVVLPHDDPLFERDVSRSGLWLGGAVADALRSLGVDAADPEPVTRRSRWSSLVCFAGTGPGEVEVAGRKAVGISQRRTRAGARFQVVVPHRFDGRGHADLVALDDAERAELAAHLDATVGAVDLPPGRLVEALRDVLTRY